MFDGNYALVAFRYVPGCMLKVIAEKKAVISKKMGYWYAYCISYILNKYHV